jgi:tetratricopeptide (TPR) repeat protein
MFCCWSPDVAAADKAARTRGGDGGARATTPTRATTPAPDSQLNPLEHNNHGVEFGAKGMWAKAVQEHEADLAGDPWNRTFRQNLSAACLKFGEALLAKKDYQAAMSKYRFAIYVDPENLPADESLSAALKATGKDPDDLNVRREEAERLEDQGNYVEAIAEYKHCVRMKLDSAEKKLDPAEKKSDPADKNLLPAEKLEARILDSTFAATK